MNYIHIANDETVKVIFIHVTMELVFHVKTRHVPRSGDNIMLGNTSYKVGEVCWNPKRDLLKPVAFDDLDYNADCVVFLNHGN